MTAGRPTDYKPEMVDQARRYIANHLDFGDPVPSVAGLACVLETTRKTIYEWAKKNNETQFGYILEELSQKQERQLIMGGLMGEYNSPITKMMMTKHGYSDKIENDHTSSDKSMTPKAGLDLSKLSDAALAEIVAARDAVQED